MYPIHQAAIDDILTKIQILGMADIAEGERKPYEYLKGRVKAFDSLCKKALADNLPLSMNRIKENIFDVSGVRIICPFLHDVYVMADRIRTCSGITIIKEKDYINNPKPSGYRSYHMIVGTVISLPSGDQYVIVEIQLRTIAMDFWATLDHQIQYKFDGIVPPEVVSELHSCSVKIADADNVMAALSASVAEANKE